MVTMKLAFEFISGHSQELVLSICTVLVVVCLVKTWIDPYRSIPGPRGLPILGNTLDFAGTADQHALLLKWAKKYGNIFKYYVIFGGYRIHITDANIAKHIIVTNSKNYRRQDVLKKLLPGFGNGLITSNGRAHAIQRKHLNPFFSLAKVQEFFPVFIEKTNELIKHWKAETSRSVQSTIERDVLEKLTHLTLDVIGLCAFGYHFNCILGGHNEESKATDAVLRGNFDLQRRSFESLFPFLKLIRSKEQREFDKAESCLKSLIKRVIAERKNFIDKVADMNKDLLSILFSMKDEKGKSISNDDIYHQVFTFLISGHETTSLSASWTLYMLAKHQNIQQRLRDEIHEIIGPLSQEISWSDLEKLEFLENCIKESMRLYPVAITTDRTSIGPDRIGPYRIPGGTHVMVGIGTLHRDETFWKDPDLFKPDRFDIKDENEAKTLQYQFLPFSRGPRMCIGYRFAMAELKVTLARLVRNFSFSLADDGQFNTEAGRIRSISTLTLKPYPHLNMQITSLDNEAM